MRPSTRRLDAMIKRQFGKWLPINYSEEQQRFFPLALSCTRFDRAPYSFTRRFAHPPPPLPAGNNWARGYSLYNTSTSVSTPILNSIRRELEASDHPTSLNILHSLAGGTGSGLGCAVTEGCKEVRLDEERSDELITPLISAKVTHARTSVQDAPPRQSTLQFSPIIPTLFAIRFPHRSSSVPSP